MFQYWSAGIPVIASPLPEHARFLGRYPAGVLMESDTIGSFLAALRALDKLDPVTTAAGIAKAKEELCWETYEELFSRRYENLAKGQRGREK
jgi:hypothetical protein